METCTPDRYFDDVDAAARHCLAAEVAPIDFLEQATGEWKRDVSALIRLRAEWVTEEEARALEGLLTVGYFPDLEESARRGAFALALDIEDARDRIDAHQRCEPYTPADPIFAGDAGLYAATRGGELVDVGAVERTAGSEFVKFGGQYARVDRSVPAALLDWLDAAFPAAARSVRLDPRRVWSIPPWPSAREALIIPARPRWWADLSILPGTHDGARHDLLPVAPSRETVRQWWDYNVRHIRRVEMHVGRDRGGTLGVLVEELPRIDPRTGLMIARCLHLDTADPVGTTLNVSTLGHIDLALNVYGGARAREREAGTIRHGVQVDATTRTHVLRVDGVPFATMFELARHFFAAPSLTDEFLAAQFGRTPGAAVG